MAAAAPPLDTPPLAGSAPPLGVHLDPACGGGSLAPSVVPSVPARPPGSWAKSALPSTKVCTVIDYPQNIRRLQTPSKLRLVADVSGLTKLHPWSRLALERCAGPASPFIAVRHHVFVDGSCEDEEDCAMSAWSFLVIAEHDRRPCRYGCGGRASAIYMRLASSVETKR